MPSTSTSLFIIALIYVFFIVRDFYANQYLTLKAKIWLWIVLVFLSVSLLI